MISSQKGQWLVRIYQVATSTLWTCYLFSDLKKHRITASVDPRNIKSVALLERIGMRKEAHFNEKCIIFLAYAIIIINEFGGKKDEEI